MTGSDAIASHTRSQRIDGGGVRHPGNVHLAIGLGHHHIEIAAVPGRVQVIDDEGARRNRGLVDDVAVLPHLHAGVGLRNAAYDRRIAALRFRIHAVVAGQLRAGETDAVEQCAVSEGLAHHQLTLQRRDRTLQTGLDVLVLVAPHVVITEVASVAQTPGAGIQPGVQAEVALGTGEALVLGTVEVAVVVQQGGRLAIVPVLGIDIATCLAVHGGLRHADIQALLTVVEVSRGVRNKLRQGHAGCSSPLLQPRGGSHSESGQVHAEAFEQRDIEARLDVSVVRADRSQCDFAPTDPLPIDQQVHPVSTRRGDVALAETVDIDVLACRTHQERVIELNLGNHRRSIRRHCRPASIAGNQRQQYDAQRVQPEGKCMRLLVDSHDSSLTSTFPWQKLPRCVVACTHQDSKWICNWRAQPMNRRRRLRATAA
ncbi:hypothetical protein D9M68_602460 [compost metagenome]